MPSIRLESDSRAPGRARQFVASLVPLAPEEMRARACTVVTELVTNSVRYAHGGVITVAAQVNADGELDVDVRDEGTGFEVRPRAPGHADEHGWGLLFVDMLSESWATGGRGAPVVWAHFSPRTLDGDEEVPRDALLDERVRDLRGFSVVARDITWRKQLDESRDELIERVKHLARSDELTGLANRRRWQEELDRELARARRSGKPMCVAMVDLDGFKTYNDAHGHVPGDRFLTDAAKAWTGATRATDMLARYGGDEFSLILPDCPVDEATAVATRLRAATPDPLTCSVGIACTDGGEPAEALIRRADLALYQAKRTRSSGDGIATAPRSASA